MESSYFRIPREKSHGTAMPYAQAQRNQLSNLADLQEVENDKQFTRSCSLSRKVPQQLQSQWQQEPISELGPVYHMRRSIPCKL